jgi:deoxyadenosine/deoxycytidine kinase
METVPVKITCVDGIISSGKSTVIKEFKTKHPECHFIDEPLSQFTHFETHRGDVISPLDMTYEDSQNASAFQLYVLEVFDDKLSAIENIPAGRKVICDRCLISAHVFTRTLQKLGSIPSFSWEYWLVKYHEVKNKHRYSIPDCFYFLQTDVKTCLNRMAIRGRDMEVKYKDMENYQRVLLETYEELLSSYDVPIIHSTSTTINGRVDELEKIVFQ